jgi:ribonuclease HII
MVETSSASLEQSTWLEFSTLSGIPGLVVGVDEVGRGALFGPVVAAAVILPDNALPILMAAKIKDSASAADLWPGFRLENRVCFYCRN